MRIHGHKVSDDLLLAFLRGDVDEMTAAQIEADPASLARAYELMRERQQILQPLLPPADARTVSDTELGAYHLGVLPADRVAEVERFLADNPGRRAEFAMLDGFLAELVDELPAIVAEVDQQPTPLVEQIVETISVLIATPLSSPLNEFALLGDEDEQHIYEVEGVQIFLTVQEDEEIPNYKALYGLVNGIELEGLSVHLWPADRTDEIVKVDVSAFGNFHIPQLKPTTYELSLKRAVTEIRIHNFQV